MDLTRQKDLIPENVLGEHITIIGAGGIGSPVAMALTKMGCERVHLIDYDVVEPHNQPNQMYRTVDMYKSKVDSLRDICRQFSDTTITVTNALVSKENKLMVRGVVVSGVDSMAARKQIWEDVLKKNPLVKLYIDARMAAEQCNIYTCLMGNSASEQAYEASLVHDSDTEPERCTAKATIYNSFMIASLVARHVKEYLVDNTSILPKELIFDMKTLTLLNIK